MHMGIKMADWACSEALFFFFYQESKNATKIGAEKRRGSRRERRRKRERERERERERNRGAIHVLVHFRCINLTTNELLLENKHADFHPPVCIIHALSFDIAALV